MKTLKFHDPIISDVMSEIADDYYPGTNLLTVIEGSDVEVECETVIDLVDVVL